MKRSILALSLLTSVICGEAHAQTEAVVAVVGTVVSEIIKNEMKDKPVDYGSQLIRMETNINQLLLGQQAIITLIQKGLKSLSSQLEEGFRGLQQSRVAANAGVLKLALAEKTEDKKRVALERLEAEVELTSGVLGSYSALAFPSALASHQTQAAIYTYLGKPEKMRVSRKLLACDTLKPWLNGSRSDSFSSIIGFMDTGIKDKINKLENQSREIVIATFPGRKSPAKEETCKHFELRESIVGNVVKGFAAEYRTEYWDCYRIIEHDGSGGRRSSNLPERPASTVGVPHYARIALLLNAYALSAWGAASPSDIPKKSARLEKFNSEREIIIGLMSDRDGIIELQQAAQTLYDGLEGEKECSIAQDGPGS